MTDTSPDSPAEELRHTDAATFSAEVKILVGAAEETRLRYMRARQSRSFIVTTSTIIAQVAGATAFGWFFLMQGNLVLAITAVGLSLLPPLLLNGWAEAPLKKYARSHKQEFMPKMAKLLGGFRYHPGGGINEKVLNATGILPAYNRYQPEDCFLGTYKGIKVIFSEARLFKGSQSVFRGLFALLEMPKPLFQGTIILTADPQMARAYAGSRWQNLAQVAVTTSNPEWNRFSVYASTPEAGQAVASEKLLKELSEAADIFNKAALSVSFIKEKYVFIAIPYEGDMFEASDMHVPIQTSSHIEEIRKEIDKLMEVIDVFEIYGRD